MFRAAINTMNPDRAVAADGWTVAELNDLPDILLQWAAVLFVHHEGASMEWPQCFTIGIVAAPRKAEEEGEEAEDPAQLFPPNAMDARPVTNLATLYGAWTMARFSERGGSGEKNCCTKQCRG